MERMEACGQVLFISVAERGVRFESSRGEVSLGFGTNNEVTSARPLSDIWLARVA